MSRQLRVQLKKPYNLQQRIEPASRQSAIAAVDKAIAAVAASTTRTISGLTAFRVKDPDPNAIGEGNILGVRLDVYSRRRRGFQAPYFIFFQELDEGLLKLHQHTIPAFVQLRPLLRRYMSTSGEDDDASTGDGKQQNLAGFVRAVRKDLVAWIRRSDAVEKLKNEAASLSSGNFRIKSVISNDPGSSELELELYNGALVRIKLASTGAIAKSSVRTKNSDDVASKRLLERVVVNHRGPLDDLATVLQQTA